MDRRGQNRLTFSSRKDGFLFRLDKERIIVENAPHPFVEPCIVSDPNLPGASPPSEASEVGEPYDGQLSPAVRRGLSCYSVPPSVSGWTRLTLFYYIRLAKRMFFDRPRTWILYEPMDRDKSLLLAMTSSFITSSFPYPSPLFDLTHQMALSSYL